MEKIKENPFNNTDVSGIYDSTDFPKVLSYQEKQENQLLKAIEWYRKGLFSNPIVNVFGDTGSGKTFLLYSMARKFHSEKKGFFIEISPLEIVEEIKIEKLTKYIWNKIDNFFVCKLNSLKCRPIDILFYKIYDEIVREEEDEESHILYKPGFLKWKRSVPVYACVNEFISKFGSHRNKEKILKRVFDERMEDPNINWLVNRFLEKDVDYNDYVSSIVQITHFARSLGFSIVLVCDQFESLDKASFRKPTGIFFTQLLELIREIKKYNSLGNPLYVNLLNSNYVDIFSGHVSSRIPKLAHGQDFISISKKLNKEQAIEIVRGYLYKRNQKGNPFDPFSLEEFEQYYDRYLENNICDIRSWLAYCRDIWNIKYYDAKPFVEISTVEEKKLKAEEKKLKPGEKKLKAEEKNSALEEIEPIHIIALRDVFNSVLHKHFLKIWQNYKECPENLVKLLYVFMNSIGNDCGFCNMSTLENDYFCFDKGNTKFYIFFSSKSNRGKGFLVSWETFKKVFYKRGNYFIKCVRSKNEDVPNRSEFSILNNKKKSHCYSFDLESRDYDWLKYIYGSIYLFGREKELANYDLPELEYSDLSWTKIRSKDSDEKVLRHFRENLLKGLI
ncbi:hypothetical protein [Candidatus Uabimicrobium sp. HlEnr_7]|uniref:hypothetical protein n=1 Tax=Candidatus Uabimicrobium helgolandensis TaxID=3095367 RepID=UPI0035569C99